MGGTASSSSAFRPPGGYNATPLTHCASLAAPPPPTPPLSLDSDALNAGENEVWKGVNLSRFLSDDYINKLSKSNDLLTAVEKDRKKSHVCTATSHASPAPCSLPFLRLRMRRPANAMRYTLSAHWTTWWSW
jgi:hypothetical protein